MRHSARILGVEEARLRCGAPVRWHRGGAPVRWHRGGARRGLLSLPPSGVFLPRLIGSRATGCGSHPKQGAPWHIKPRSRPIRSGSTTRTGAGA